MRIRSSSRPKGSTARCTSTLARRVASGDLALGTEPFFVAPLYAYVLGLLLAVSGGSLLFAKCVQVVLGTAAVGLIAATASRWQGRRAGWAAGALAAATGLFTFHEVVILQAALDPFLAALALFLLARALPEAAACAFAAAGVAFGLFALNRPNALACAAVIALALLLRRRAAPRRWIQAGAFAAGVRAGDRAGDRAQPRRLRRARADLLARRAELLHRQQPRGRRHVPLGSRHHAEHRRPGARRDPAGGAGGGPRADGAARSRATSRARPGPGSATEPGAAREAVPAQARLRLQRGRADAELQLPLLQPRRADAAARPRGRARGCSCRSGSRASCSARSAGTPGFAVWASFVPAYALSVAAFFVSGRYRLPLLVPLCVGGGFAVELLATARRQPRRRLAAAARRAPPWRPRWRSGPSPSTKAATAEREQMALWLLDNGPARRGRAPTWTTHSSPQARTRARPRARGARRRLRAAGPRGRRGQASSRRPIRLDPASASAKSRTWPSSTRRRAASSRPRALLDEALRLRPDYPQALGPAPQRWTSSLEIHHRAEQQPARRRERLARPEQRVGLRVRARCTAARPAC